MCSWCADMAVGIVKIFMNRSDRIDLSCYMLTVESNPLVRYSSSLS